MNIKMKKHITNSLKFTFLILISFLIFQCTEDPEPFQRSEVVTETLPSTTAIRLPYGTNTKTMLQLNMKMGHEQSECTGCVLINGVPTHVPCRGPGTSCNVSSIVLVTTSESHVSLINGDPFDYYTVTSVDHQILDSLNLFDDFRNDNLFLIPNRTFWVSGNFVDWRSRWMNIPEQFVKRNNDDSLLYYERVTFTSYPLFINE